MAKDTTIQAWDGDPLEIPLKVYLVCCRCGLKHLHHYKITHRGRRHILTLTAWKIRRWRKKT